MGRINDRSEGQREQLEANLARLGNALVYLRLVSDRVQAAARVKGFEGMLLPAVDDCKQAARLIQQVQKDIAP
jgi:hypothetical protein